MGSSIGRALALGARGYRFETCSVDNSQNHMAKRKIEGADYPSFKTKSFTFRYLKETDNFFITDDKKVFLEFSIKDNKNIEFQSKEVNLEAVTVISKNITKLLNLKKDDKSTTNRRNNSQCVVPSQARIVAN